MIWPAFTDWGVEDTWRLLCGGGNGPNKEAEFLERAGEKYQGTDVGLADRRQEHALCSVLRQLRGWRWGSGKRTGWKQKGQGIFIKSPLLTLPNTMENLTDGAREQLWREALAGLPKDLAAQFPHQVAHKCP